MSDFGETSAENPGTPRIARPRMLLAIFGVFAVVVILFYVRSRSRMRPELESAVPALSADAGLKYTVGALGWNRFRGPNGTGHVSGSTIPLEWGDDKNLAWKTPIPGDGSSSPVVTEESVFVTSYTREDASSAEIVDLTRHVHCIDRDSGNVRWTKAFPATLPEDSYAGRGLPEHGYASSTPVTDGQSLFVFFGKSGAYCFDLNGNQVWHRELGDSSNAMGWGSCSSPILYRDTVIVNAAEESRSLVALNRQTGEEVWTCEADRLPFTFGTPALVDVGDRIEIVVAVRDEVWGINPESGKLLWFARSPIGGNVSPSVVVDGRLVYAFGGFGKRGSICVEAGGRGDVTESKVRWTSKHTPYVPTPVLADGKLYWVDSGGKFYCLDAATGELLARDRMKTQMVGDGYAIYSSLIAIDGNLLLQTRRRGVAVLATADKLSVLHHNQFADDSRCNATPAVSGGQLFLRSDDFLYCVQATEPDNAE